MPKTADAYFRAVFSITEVAQQLLRFKLPTGLLALLNLDTLALAPDSFVDQKLRKSLSDLVYTCHLKDGFVLRICLLFEHKSHPPGRLLYPQINRYIYGIQEEDVKQKRKEFTLTVPILFYHGAEAWSLQPLAELYGTLPEDLSRFVPTFDIVVVNLQEMSREEMLAMQDTMLLRNIFLVMKKAWDDKFFKAHVSEVAIFADENVSEDILFMLFDLTWFFIQQVSSFKEKELMDTITALPPKYGKRVKSTYQRIVESAEKRGKLEGTDLGLDIAIKKIILGFPMLVDQEIADKMEVPLERVKKLREDLKTEQS